MFAGLLEVCVWRVWAGTTSGRGAHFKSETLAAVFARREGIDRVGGLNPLRWAFSQLASQQFSRATQACITAGPRGDEIPPLLQWRWKEEEEDSMSVVLFYFMPSVSISPSPLTSVDFSQRVRERERVMKLQIRLVQSSRIIIISLIVTNHVGDISVFSLRSRPHIH